MVTNSKNCNDSNNKSLTNEFKKAPKTNTLFNSSIASPYGSSFRKESFAASFGGDTYRNSFGVSSDLESTTISHSESMSESVGSSTGSSMMVDSKMPTRQTSGSKPHIKTISTRQSNNSNPLKSGGSIMSSLKPQLGSSSALTSTSSRHSSGMGSSSSSAPNTQSFPLSSGSGSGSGYASGSGYSSGSGYNSGSPSVYNSGSPSVYNSNSNSVYNSGTTSVYNSTSASAYSSASGSGSAYASVSGTIAVPGAAPMKPQQVSSNCASGSPLVSSSVVSGAGSFRQSIISSGPAIVSSSLRQQSVMGSGSLKQSGYNGSTNVSARPSVKSITSNISKTASSYNYDCGQEKTSAPLNGSTVGKSPSIVSKKSEANNCGSAALPIFETPIADPKGCTASKTSLSGKSVTLNVDSRRSSKLSNKLGSCTSLPKSAFGSVKKSQSRTTLVSNAPSCKSNKSSSSNKGENKNGFISEVENAILRSTDAPIDIKETEEIKGIYR